MSGVRSVQSFSLTRQEERSISKGLGAELIECSEDVLIDLFFLWLGRFVFAEPCKVYKA